jgi:hypothetical protein
VKIFRLMKSHPLEGVRDLLRLFDSKLRAWALLLLCRSFKPSIDLVYLQEVLNFESPHELLTFLTSIGGVVDEPKTKLLIKESKQAVSESKLLQGGFK